MQFQFHIFSENWEIFFKFRVMIHINVFINKFTTKTLQHSLVRKNLWPGKTWKKTKMKQIHKKKLFEHIVFAPSRDST